MNKYELALVVSANVEDEVRTATIEKVNELITRFGGTITDPGTSEKKKLAYDIQHMSEGFYSFIKFEAEAAAPAGQNHNYAVENRTCQRYWKKQHSDASKPVQLALAAG